MVHVRRAFDDDWLKKDPLVFVLGFLGWTVPSTIGVSAFGGSSLFGLFTSSIGENMVRHSSTAPFCCCPQSPCCLPHGRTCTVLCLGVALMSPRGRTLAE
jgi:hypothetical protein